MKCCLYALHLITVAAIICYYYAGSPAQLDQMEMEVETSHHHKSKGASHRADSNGFPIRNGEVISGRPSRFVHSNPQSNGNLGSCFNSAFVDDESTGVSPPPVAVVNGGQHYSTGPRQSATRTITMSLKRLLREQEDFCPL